MLIFKLQMVWEELQQEAWNIDRKTYLPKVDSYVVGGGGVWGGMGECQYWLQYLKHCPTFLNSLSSGVYKAKHLISQWLPTGQAVLTGPDEVSEKVYEQTQHMNSKVYLTGWWRSIQESLASLPS